MNIIYSQSTSIENNIKYTLYTQQVTNIFLKYLEPEPRAPARPYRLPGLATIIKMAPRGTTGIYWPIAGANRRTR